MNSTKSWFDWLGVLASFGCAIHCAAMPFVISFLPLLGLNFLADEGFHQVMVGVCLLLAAAAFVPGWRKHRRLLPAGIASVGLALISTAAFALEDTCCAACAAASTQVALDESGTEEAEVCTDACCEHCAAAAKEANQSDEQRSDDTAHSTAVESDNSENAVQLSAAGFPVALTPWVTPFGGVLLILAHLANHHLLCRKDCCPSTH